MKVQAANNDYRFNVVKLRLFQATTNDFMSKIDFKSLRNAAF